MKCGWTSGIKTIDWKIWKPLSWRGCMFSRLSSDFCTSDVTLAIEDVQVVRLSIGRLVSWYFLYCTGLDLTGPYWHPITMPYIFSTMPRIFCTIPHIFGTILHTFGNMPHIFDTMLHNFGNFLLFFMLFFTVSYWFLLFLTVSYFFLLFLTVSYCEYVNMWGTPSSRWLFLL